MITLHTLMLEAHAADDKGALIGLYTQAADRADDVDAECFFLTHAYVFALEAADPRAQDLRARLVTHGREVEA
ncbi:hypothetical protein [Sulfitobacter donghicola]|uniref:hypothetical protein n=1 Tax=Sulfitobacter donghicola TaxID=421000 RepID=UPI000469FC65|nr:hypothetical protein [Sulfitobacter donghicola]KIN66508.1 hypothetical protein Z948_205 [Sulfitobacter donghicola DSW-25 = KCTC 12864 = JCM 14565]